MMAKFVLSDNNRIFAPIVILTIGRLIWCILLEICRTNGNVLSDHMYLGALLVLSMVYRYALYRRRRQDKTNLPYPFYVFFIFLSVGILINLLLHLVNNGSNETSGDVSISILTILSSCIISPVFEELIFRHIFLPDFEFFGLKSSIVLSSILFALNHGTEEFLYAFCLGAALGYIYVSRGLLCSVLFHMLHNIFLVVSYMIKSNCGTYLYSIYSLVCTITIFALGIVGAYLIYRGYNEKKS